MYPCQDEMIETEDYPWISNERCWLIGRLVLEEAIQTMSQDFSGAKALLKK